MVPGAGLEPARCFHRRILSPLRLPISPPGLTGKNIAGIGSLVFSLMQLFELLSTTTPPGLTGKTLLGLNPLSLALHVQGRDNLTRLLNEEWRLEPESNRRTRLCRPLHNHSAIEPSDDLLQLYFNAKR